MSNNDANFLEEIKTEEGYERWFTEYVGQDWLDEYGGTLFEQLRREEFDCYINYCRRGD